MILFFNLDFRGTMSVYGQIHPLKITLIYIVINQMIALLLKKLLLLKEGACYSRLELSNNCRAKFINQSNCIPTFTLLLDFDRSCHNQNVFQGYINLIGYTYLSLEYSAFVCTAQKALTKRISNPSGSTK